MITVRQRMTALQDKGERNNRLNWTEILELLALKWNVDHNRANFMWADGVATNGLTSYTKTN